ncbi:MAG: prepilin-type N-terminal cleavage/methylation domain-containing protein [Planctomycetota bacterium]
MASCGFERRKAAARRGFTLVEMMTVLVIVAMAWWIFAVVVLSLMDESAVLSAHNLLARWNQEIVNDIRDDTLSAKRYFENDSLGQQYLDALEEDADSPWINSLRLPRIEESGAALAPDTVGNQKTGNALLFTKVLTPFVVTVPYREGEDRDFRINVYRFVLYYLTIREKEHIGRCKDSLDLMRWASVPLADYAQVMAIEDPEPADSIDPRAEIVKAFVAQQGSEWLWDTSSDLDNAFYKCQPTGQIDTSPWPNMVIPRDSVEGLRSLIPAKVAKNKHASVCWNNGTNGFDAGIVVPRYAIANATGDGFPHGLEVQIVGPSGARELCVRLAMAKGTGKKVVGREFTAILTTRDF